ncbi:MAG: hypothetical protein ACR2QE_01250 [Acidimicrobiales bacterium]
MPAVLLIVIVLGSIAVDFGVVHLRQRELHNAAAAAANDGAGAGLDIDHLRATGERRLDPARAAAAAEGAVAARAVPGMALVDVQVVDPLTIQVTVALTVEPVLGRVVGAGARKLQSTQTASLLAP